MARGGSRAAAARLARLTRSRRATVTAPSLPPARSKFDHYCPLVWNAVGEGNQAYFVLFCLTMLVGQLTFLYLGSLFLAERGEGVLFVLTTRLGTGWTAEPVVMVNMLAQAAATAFNLLLCVRALYGIAAELSSNEMVNTARYPYLHAPDGGAYDNPFDAGVLANAWRFFDALRGAPLTDWDALAAAARAGKAPQPPLLSMARLFRLTSRIRAVMGWSRSRGGGGGADGGHGHSHGGRPCGHDHGGGGVPTLPTHVRTRDGLVPFSELPPAVQAQLMAHLAAMREGNAAGAPHGHGQGQGHGQGHGHSHSHGGP
jgi:hypothetical protein